MKLLGPGDQIGPYRVIGPYPGGGLRAIHATDHHRRVHIRVRETADDWRECVVQSLRAASLVGALEHPGIARILDRGVLPDRRPWLASELAEGVVLSDILARRVLAVDETLAIVRDLAAIAMHVHARGLIHGAIHPHAIVMCTGERRFPIQLGGWGELRTAGTTVDDAIPPTAYPKGTCSPGGSLAYAAPESRWECAADVYAIGVLAYRALTGHFPGGVTPELVAGVPGAASSLIVRMLARDPAKRPDAATLYTKTSELTGDRVLSGPRFARPRWTPMPTSDGERMSSVLDIADARLKRS